MAAKEGRMHDGIHLHPALAVFNPACNLACVENYGSKFREHPRHGALARSDSSYEGDSFRPHDVG
jgi:hypothetical protein